MAVTEARSAFRRGRGVKRPSGIRVLTAAATRLEVNNRAEVRRQRSIRQAWQNDAFVYRNTIGELRYAVAFLANCAARMRIFPAVLMPQAEKTDVPVEIGHKTPATDVPPEVTQVCIQALEDLGNGRAEVANHMRTLSTNLSLAGEAYLLGQEDQVTLDQVWSVRSISEIVVYNDEIMLREGPIDGTGLLGLVHLDPELTVVSRMWQPDPQFRLIADSPMRALMNECEALLILRRSIRAIGRSSLAGRGLLLFPDELSIAANNNDNSDPEADPVLNALIDAMVTPIANEGDASSVVPTVVRGPADSLKEIRLVTMNAQFDELSQRIREELVGVIGTGLDLPKEIITGIADLNHWSAWQVDDNTFRHHVEPHVISAVDCLTGAFLRPYFATAGLAPDVVAEWLPRVMFWYDPTELVTHPDRTSNATTLHASLAISDKAFREALGFSEEDAPDDVELELRMVRTTRTWPPNALMALLHVLDPNLSIPPITGPGQIPGVKPGIGGGAILPELPAGPGGAETGAKAPGEPSPAGPGSTPPAAPGPPPAPAGPAPTTADIAAAAKWVEPLTGEARRVLLRVVRETLFERHGIDTAYFVRPTAAGAVVETAALEVVNRDVLVAAAGPTPSERSIRLSRKLAAVDVDLRARLTTAANAAMVRQLERAGSRLRQKVAPNETLRTQIALTRNELVMSRLGPEVVAASGITASGLLHEGWEQLKEAYFSWTRAAQERAIALAAQLGGFDAAEAQEKAQTALDRSAADGWKILAESMDALALNIAYNPHPDSADPLESLNPDTLVPSGVIRASVAVGGGADPRIFGAITDKSGAEVRAQPLGIPVGGIGSGPTIGGMLSSAGAQVGTYEWEHGPSLKPFEPHEALDGVTFAQFDDPALANSTGFPGNAFFYPGDHLGCLCDTHALWISAADVDAAQAALAGG